MLTPAMKLARPVISKRYEKEIEVSLALAVDADFVGCVW